MTYLYQLWGHRHDLERGWEEDQPGGAPGSETAAFRCDVYDHFYPMHTRTWICRPGKLCTSASSPYSSLSPPSPLAPKGMSCFAPYPPHYLWRLRRRHLLLQSHWTAHSAGEIESTSRQHLGITSASPSVSFSEEDESEVQNNYLCDSAHRSTWWRWLPCGCLRCNVHIIHGLYY